MMNFYKKLLEHRWYIGLVLLALTIPFGFLKMWDLFGWSMTFAVIAIGSHLFFGPIRLIQEAMQANDMERAKKMMKLVHFPALLFKPIRQGYYMLQSNLAMNDKDYDKAENLMKKSIKSSSKMMGTENEGASYLQLGMIAMQNGKTTEARKNLRTAIQKGLPDNETLAAAYLQLSSIEIQARNLKIGKEYFKKAKKLKPTTPEIKSQLVQMEKYIHRVR